LKRLADEYAPPGGIVTRQKGRTDMEGKKYTLREWRTEGERLFGRFIEDWKFKCPKCGNIASGQEFKDAGADSNSIYCECIGRYVKGKGCDWAAYGLFDICTVHVDGHPVFEFAEVEQDED
jgi:hypothetical protein